MFRYLKPLGIAALTFLLPLSLSAALISLPPLEDPLLFLSPGTLSYDPATGSHLLDIDTPVVLMDGPAAVIAGGHLSADLTLDNATCEQVGTGTFQVTGTTQIGATSFTSPLLSAT